MRVKYGLESSRAHSMLLEALEVDGLWRVWSIPLLLNGRTVLVTADTGEFLVKTDEGVQKAKQQLWNL
jgi:hypothetical protein